MANQVFYKTDDDIALMRESGLLVSKVLGEIANIIKPGMTGKQIDKIAEEFILDNKAKPAFKGYRGFPNTLCVSVNDIVVHGIPSDYEFKDGDVVSVDCGVCLNGFYGDSAYTFPIGEVAPDVMELLSVTKTALYKGIERAIIGNRIGDVASAVQEYAESRYRYGVVRELVGHGIGRSLHEAPEVPNYGKRGQGMLLKGGLVIAIEPMINMGVKEVVQSKDGWTIKTRDGKPSAHYEHTVLVKKDKAEMLTNHEFVENATKNNPEIREVPIKS